MILPTLASAVVLVAPCAAQWSTDQLSLPRDRHAATSVGAKILFAGGFAGSAGGGVSAGVDVFDTATGTWSVEQLSQARADLTATSVGGIALVAGGGPDGRVDLYDEASGTWSTASLSQPWRELLAASAGTKALFAGGYALPAGATTWVETDRVDIFDAATGTWSQDTFPLVRRDMAATSVGDLVLFGGGVRGSITQTAYGRIDVYDTVTDTWSTSSLSQARSQVAATRVGDLAIFAGGFRVSPPSFSDRVDIYDAASGTWSTSALSQPRSRLVATSVGHLALFADFLSDVVEIYDTRDGTWTTASLFDARRGLVAASAGRVALFAGGRLGTWYSDVVDVFSLDLGTPYCFPQTLNSSGLAGLLRAEGLLANAELTLIAERLPPGRFGYVIAGLTQGLLQPPGSQGAICLSGNIGRYNRAGEILVGPAGALTVDLALIPVNPPAAAQPGDTWNFQCWYRDVNPGPTSNTTNGLAITVPTPGDPSVQFPVTEARLVEDATQIEVRITLSQRADEDVVLAYAVGGTATVDVDWRVEEPNPFVIPAGRTSAEMTLTLAEDSLMEPDEVAIVSFAAPVGAVLGTATTFTLTIVDDD